LTGKAGFLLAIDADTKLILSWYVGHRDADSANEFMRDVSNLW
jgi:hypothetical protein